MTGGTGFVGATLLDVARDAGHRVRALTRRDQADRDGVEWIAGDLADGAALARLVAGTDAVVHIAGVVNAPDKAGFEAGNVAGTMAVLTAAKNAGISRFVHVSSLSARDPLLSHYGASKLAAEDAVRASDRDWAIVRPPAVYGPRDGEMLELFRAAQRLGIVPIPPPGRASMIHAEDLSRLLLALAESGAHSHVVYDADDGRDGGWPHEEMARALGDAVGRPVTPRHIPARVMKLAACIDRLARRSKAKLTPDRVGYMIHPDWSVAPERRPPADLWQPQIETREGLRQTAKWYRANGML